MGKENYQKTAETVLKELETGSQGLSIETAVRRRSKYGANELRGTKQQSVLRIFLSQFADFLVIVLLAAAGISAVLGDLESMLVILAVITMNAVLGTIQTQKAAASLDSLKQMSAPSAKVYREKTLCQIPASEVTIGDVVVLEAGDCVCADGRLLELASLKVDESALTGESVPVEKDTASIEEEAALGDRRNMVFSGSFVTYGRGKFVVTAIGMDTEMGKIATLLQNTEEKKTPLQVSLDQFGRKLSLIIAAICAVLFAVSVLIRKEPPVNAFLFAVALAVAAIPEALSSIVTIVLSFGTQKMAKEKAVVRKLQAVEGLGSVSVICSDKTGTLTQNKMTVQKLYVDGMEIDDDELSLDRQTQTMLLWSALLCSDAVADGNKEVGDPTETALVRLGMNYGLEAQKVRAEYPRLAELPFDSDRKLMSTINEMNGRFVMVTKGAVDVLLDRTRLTDEERDGILKANENFSQNGLRVLAFTYRILTQPQITPADETDMEFLGLIAMMDPPRTESKQAVAECIAAGIKPVMITGDHRVTAAAIAKQIGILNDDSEAVEGAILDGMTDEELQAFVPNVSVYARVTPNHKIRIVRAWQERGCIVSMTGDGVNDAPALKQADIGVAMGITGTEVAKDAASMVLLDDNFASIIKAIENGRNIYANIKRSIQFLLSGNTAGLITVLYASMLGLPVPFAAVHLLFINLLTDSLPAIALGLEPYNDGVMQQKPRPRTEGILTRDFLRAVAVEGLVIAAATITAFHIGLANGGETVGSTMAFATLCLSRLFHGFNCKAARPVLFSHRMWNNPYLLAAFGIGAVLLGSVLLIPALEPLFKAASLTPALLMTVTGLAFGSMLAIQLIKYVRTQIAK